MIFNSSMQRLLWKDYRDYRGLWWAMLIGAAFFFFMMIGVEIWQQASYRSPPPIRVLEIAMLIWFVVAVCFPAAIGATSFSREHEQETFVFLRTLPIRSWNVLLCRGGLVAFGTLVLFGLFFGLTALTSSFTTRLLFSASHPDAEQYIVEMLSVSLLIAAEAFVIGVFFSLTTKQPLFALLMTGITMMLLHGTILMSIGAGSRDSSLGGWHALVVIATIAFGILDFVRIPQWFQEGDAMANPVAAAPKQRISSVRVNRATRSSKSSSIRALIWQQWRQFGILYALAIPISIGLLFTRFWIVGALVIPVLLSTTVFYQEKQNNRYRFLSQRGVHPLTVWIARNSVLLPLVAIPCLVMAFGEPWSLAEPGRYALAPLFAFLIAQFCILVTEQFIVGIFLAILGAALTAGWCVLANLLDIPFALGFLPLLVGLLAAGYKRLSDLLSEKSRVVNKSMAWSIVGCGVLATFVATSFYRVYSIPSTNGREMELVKIHEAASLRTAEQTEAFKAFQNAATQISSLPSKTDGRFHFTSVQLLTDGDEGGNWIDSNNDYIADTYEGDFETPVVRGNWTHKWSNLTTISPEEVSWKNENNETLQSIAKALDDPRFATGSDDLGDWRQRDVYNRATRLLVSSARTKTADGKLGEALDDYKRALRLTKTIASNSTVYEWVDASYLEHMVLENLVWWAGDKDQTKGEIVTLMEWLTERNAEPPSPINSFAADYVLYKDFFWRPDRLEQILESSVVERMTFIYRFVPWEKSRSARLFDYMSVSQLDWMRQKAAVLKSSGPYLMPMTTPSSKNFEVIQNTLVSGQFVHSEEGLINSAISLENRRRAIMWQLRLIAHRIEHGTYPETLEEVETLVEFRNTNLLSGKVFEYDRAPLPVYVNEPIGSFYIVTESPSMADPDRGIHAGSFHRYTLP